MSVWARMRAAVGLAVVALSCSACVALGGIDRTTGTIDRSAGTARNNSVLTNIIRASKGQPLYFFSVSRVSGNAVEDLKLSFPALTLGPDKTNAQRSFTFGTNGLNVLDSQRSGSFDVGLLDSRNFYQGLLTPLDLGEVDLLLKQGFPRELVYRLAVQDLTIYDRTGLHRYVNDPASPTYGAFQTYFRAAISHGITTESFTLRLPPGPDEGKAAAGRAQPHARLCFDPTLAHTDAQTVHDIAAAHAACGERVIEVTQRNEDAAASLKGAYEACRSADTAQRRDRVCAFLGEDPLAVQLNTRSLFAVFRYLGAQLRAEGAGTPVMLEGMGEAVEAQARGPLMTIHRGGGRGCFATAELGERYCLPQAGGENLMATFAIINALQALKTSPGDLPVTQTVRLEQ